jgi:hypothetical protein
MDGTLPWSLFNTLEAAFSSLGNVALVVAINPWVLAAVVPVRLGLRRTKTLSVHIGILAYEITLDSKSVTPISNFFVIQMAGAFFFLRHVFLLTSREAKRLEAIAYSPVMVQVSETVQGMYRLVTDLGPFFRWM